ncbi:MAG: sugar isomerase [Planctomycetes bacterium]|nr:sugar isomerase [Planctomycetota bacterium]
MTVLNDPIRVGVLFLRRKRPGFDPDWGTEMETAAKAQLSQMNLDVFIPAERIVDGASLRRALEECTEAGAEILVTLQTTMSDGRLAPILGQLWDAPVVLWATPEKQEGSMISACSLVGNHMFASTLHLLQRPFEIVYGMPGEGETEAQLDRAVRIAHAVHVLSNAKVGLIGNHAPGFVDMHADPFLLSRTFGTQMQHISLHEFLSVMEDAPEDSVLVDIGRAQELGLPLLDVSEDELPTSSRYYVSMKQIMEEEWLDGLTIRDWPELPNIIEQWPYLAMARLSSEGKALGCEGDVDGTVSCLMAGALGCGVSTLSDWLEHDHSTVTLWHAGNAPFQLCEPMGSERGPKIARHFNNQKPAVVDANLKVDSPITLFRLWHCDGDYFLMACDARTIPPRRPLKGTNGLAEIENHDVVEWFEDLCHAGMPHHVSIVQGYHADTMRRFARQMRIHWMG